VDNPKSQKTMLKNSLFQFLPGFSHGLKLLLDLNRGIVSSLQKLSSEQIECLEGASTGINFSAVLLEQHKYEGFCLEQNKTQN
jgi:hypothetical protein